MQASAIVLIGVLCVLIAPGCKASDPQCGPFIGDPSRPAEARLVALSQGQVVDVTDGSALSLEYPPQGGYVVYVGARVRNVSSCNADFQGQLLEPLNGNVLGFDRRQANLVLGADGWGRAPAPETSNFPNVNLCPDNSPNDVQARTLTLEMKITDRDGRTVTVSAPVVPRCQFADPGMQFNCVCTCSASYFPGKCGFGDGGNSDGSTERD